MSDDKDKQRTQSDEELEREIRAGRKFSVAEAIGRMAGPGAMKGVSPVPPMQQAVFAIENWLRERIGTGEIQAVLVRRIKESDLLLNNFEKPLFVLAAYCQQLLGSDYLEKEFVREVDVEWGRVNGERPHFEREGCAPDPDDPFTFASVRQTLAGIVEQLGAENGL